jgi:D-sedoheptulose 7-phosphate isomerase
MTATAERISFLRRQFQMRNELFATYIARHAADLARVCQRMSQRFSRGGRLLAVGVGPYSSDAQHVAVEFMHPIIVGKRALPAIDLSHCPAALGALAGADDIVMGFGPPRRDAELNALLATATARGALVCSWPGQLDDAPLPPATDDPFLHQEITELMYHTLWETVHLFFEQQGRGEDVGAAAFLYPFLGQGDADGDATLADVAASIQLKANEDARLRDRFVFEQSEQFTALVSALQKRIDAGGALIVCGNGGSATDANDFVLDCVDDNGESGTIPAISLSMDPAVLTAITNDVGVEVAFSRQLIAVGRPQDVAIVISTSGKSKNIILALAEARKQGMLTFALLGYDGGDVVRDRLADHTLVVRSDYVPRVQEVQASIYHVLRSSLVGSGAR